MSNIRVLIVDDEELVRDGLRQYVSWYDYGMEVVSVAENGKEALEYLQCNDVELIVSDIYMPHVDGLVMVEKLKELGKSPLVILISGHSDFEYAKRAIKTNMVYEYILKPIDFEELDKVLAGAKEQIIESTNSKEFPVLSNEEWKLLSSSEKKNDISKQSAIINDLKLVNLKEAEKKFVETWEFMIKAKFSENMISRYCIELLMGIIELVLEQRNSRDLLFEDPIVYIRSQHELAEIKNYVLSILKTAYEVVSRKENKDLSPIINVALDYINENYNNHVQSLNSLADRLNVSPNYLCLRFKEETGINYTKYLNSLRVKHAKELLRDVRLKVYMISDMVGFEDTRYFSRIFRSYTGYTPTEYQKKEAIRK